MAASVAVIIGGGIGGLAAAAAALKHDFDKIIVLDKDQLIGVTCAEEDICETARRRCGVAQYIQPHLLLAGGAENLESLVPGFTDELCRRGAPSLDVGSAYKIYDFGGYFARGHAGVQVYGASRRLINEVLQDLVCKQAGERLVLRDQTKVAGLLYEPQDITGAARDVRGVVLDSGEEISADVVIVSAGRRSQLPRWLKEIGVVVPPKVMVDCKLVYASRWMRVPADFNPDREFYGTVCVDRVHSTRGGAAYLCEDGMIQVILFGAGHKDAAPTDEEGWREFAASLPKQDVYNLISRCEPLTKPMRFAGVPNVSHEYSKSPNLPRGLYILGDAFMALNPVYGQGMTVASLGARLLDRTFRDALHTGQIKAKNRKSSISMALCVSPSPQVLGAEDSSFRKIALHAASRGFHAKQHKEYTAAWRMATQEDMRYPQVEIVGTERPPSLMYRYMDGVLTGCQKDIKIWGTVLRVTQFLDSPAVLFSPRVMRHGFVGVVRGGGGGSESKTKSKTKNDADIGGGGGEALAKWDNDASAHGGSLHKKEVPRIFPWWTTLIMM